LTGPWGRSVDPKYSPVTCGPLFSSFLLFPARGIVLFSCERGPGTWHDHDGERCRSTRMFAAVVVAKRSLCRSTAQTSTRTSLQHIPGHWRCDDGGELASCLAIASRDITRPSGCEDNRQHRGAWLRARCIYHSSSVIYAHRSCHVPPLRQFVGIAKGGITVETH